MLVVRGHAVGLLPLPFVLLLLLSAADDVDARSTKTSPGGLPVLGVLVPDNDALRREYEKQVRKATQRVSREGIEFDVRISYVDASDTYALADAAVTLIEQGVAALFFYDRPDSRPPQSHENAGLMLDISDDYEKPVLVHNIEGFIEHQGTGRDRDELLMAIMPTHKQQMAAVADFLRTNGWNRVILFTEDFDSATYVGANLRVAVEVCELDGENLQGSVNSLTSLIHQHRGSTNIIFVLASFYTSTQLAAYLKRTDLASSSSNVFIYSTGAVQDDNSRIDPPPGAFVFRSSTPERSGVTSDPMAPFYLGVRAFGLGLQTSALAGHDIGRGLTQGIWLHICMQVGDTERWGDTGFDDDGQLLSAALEIYHVKSRLSWKRVGDWRADKRLDMAWPGGERNKPAPHPGTSRH